MAPPSVQDLLAFREARIRRLEYAHLDLSLRRARLEAHMLSAELDAARKRLTIAIAKRPSWPVTEPSELRSPHPAPIAERPFPHSTQDSSLDAFRSAFQTGGILLGKGNTDEAVKRQRRHL